MAKQHGSHGHGETEQLFARFNIGQRLSEKWKLRLWKGFVGFWILYILAPMILLILVSFDSAPFLRVPREFSLVKYEAMLESGSLLTAVRRTFELAVVTAIVTTLLAIGAILTYRQTRFKRLMIVAIVLPLFIPGVVQGFSLMMILTDQLGFGVPFIRKLIGHVIWAFPFAFLVLLTSMSSVREDNILASSDLGANEYLTFKHIIYPQIKPGIISAFIFSFVLSFNEFARTFYLQGNIQTVPTFVWAQIQVTESPELYALSGVTVLVSLALIGIGSLYLYRST